MCDLCVLWAGMEISVCVICSEVTPCGSNARTKLVTLYKFSSVQDGIYAL